MWQRVGTTRMLASCSRPLPALFREDLDSSYASRSDVHSNSVSCSIFYITSLNEDSLHVLGVQKLVEKGSHSMALWCVVQSLVTTDLSFTCVSIMFRQRNQLSIVLSVLLKGLWSPGVHHLWHRSQCRSPPLMSQPIFRTTLSIRQMWKIQAPCLLYWLFLMVLDLPLRLLSHFGNTRRTSIRFWTPRTVSLVDEDVSAASKRSRPNSVAITEGKVQSLRHRLLFRKKVNYCYLVTKLLF